MVAKKLYNIRPETQEKFRGFLEIFPDTRDEKVYLTLKSEELIKLGAETIACLLLPTRGALVKFSGDACERILEGLSYYGEPPDAEYLRKNLKTKSDETKALLKEIERADPEIWREALFLVCLYQCRDRVDMESFEQISEETIYDDDNF
ncbi:MAG: hypothetical protein Kow0090_15790 [Myxococcota bacterium]